MSVYILVVDDEPDIRAIARLSLGRIGGWEVLEAASGPEAVRLAAEQQPDIVLLDVMMPAVDGVATFLLLQEQESTRSIPVLLLTGRSDPAESAGWIALGVRAVLVKPFDPMTLADQVAEALGWSR